MCGCLRDELRLGQARRFVGGRDVPGDQAREANPVVERQLRRQEREARQAREALCELGRRRDQLVLSPEPVSTTARTSGSRLSRVNMSRSSAKYEWSTSSSSTGAKVTVATPPPTWNWRCLKAA